MRLLNRSPVFPALSLAISAALSLVGCGESHGRGGCEGDAPECLTGRAGESYCCLTGTESSATCVDDAWTCPARSFLRSECTTTDSVCLGMPPFDAALPPLDSGPPPFDSGLRPCDAGPRALCMRGFGGSPSCCLEGDTAEWLCDASGALACPPGYFSTIECGRVDPVCEGIDAGPGPGLYDDCTVTSECTLMSQTCCGVCGQPTAGDVAAVNGERTSDYYRDVSCPESADGPVACPDCAAGLNPHLIATCDMTGFRPACAVVDFAASPFSECSGAEDCVLATASCCACGEIPSWQTIAVNRDEAGQIHTLTCDDPTGPCDPCVAIFDPSLSAACDAGRCTVLRVDG